MRNHNIKQIDIDNREFNFSNDGILSFLKDFIEYKEKIYDDDGDEIDLYFRLLMVCTIIGYLSDEKILNHTLDFLKMIDLVDVLEEDFENELRSKYSEIDVIKIKAIYYSLTSSYRLHTIGLKFPNSKNSIRLDIELKGRVIKHNLQEVVKSIHKNNVLHFEKLISILPINEQKEKIDKWVRSALKMGYSNDTKMYKEEIKYLTRISNHLIEIETPKKSDFSCLQWATIFYYADSVKSFEQKYLTKRMDYFIEKHKIPNAKKAFNTSYYEAKNSINTTNKYSIETLNLILPFVKENYNKAVTIIENDKSHLKIEQNNDIDY